MAMPQCCYLAKGAKRPSHTTNTIKFDRIPFDQKVRPQSFRPEKFDLFTATVAETSLSPTRPLEAKNQNEVRGEGITSKNMNNV